MCTTILSTDILNCIIIIVLLPACPLRDFVFLRAPCRRICYWLTLIFSPLAHFYFHQVNHFPPSQYTQHHSYYCLTFHTRVCPVFLAVVFPCLRVLMHGCCFAIRLITRSTLCVNHPTYLMTTWLLPADTRRRYDVEYWLYLRRDFGQRTFNVFTTSDC